jgi:hypothetical protein
MSYGRCARRVLARRVWNASKLACSQASRSTSASASDACL